MMLQHPKNMPGSWQHLYCTTRRIALARLGGDDGSKAVEEDVPEQVPETPPLCWSDFSRTPWNRCVPGMGLGFWVLGFGLRASRQGCRRKESSRSSMRAYANRAQGLGNSPLKSLAACFCLAKLVQLVLHLAFCKLQLTAIVWVIPPPSNCPSRGLIKGFL